MEASDLGTLIDVYYETREKRLELDRQSETFAKVEKEYKEQIMFHMEREGVYAMGGALCTVKLKLTPKPSAKNWAEIWQWAKENDAPEIYYRRLNEATIKERMDQGEEIPGIEFYPVATLSVSKGPNQ
jgi:hypothetical protein